MTGGEASLPQPLANPRYRISAPWRQFQAFLPKLRSARRSLKLVRVDLSAIWKGFTAVRRRCPLQADRGQRVEKRAKGQRADRRASVFL